MHRIALFILGLVAAIAVASDATAHAVGVSQSVFVIRRGGAVTAEIVFSKSDALVLARIDSNHDGDVSPEELQASVPVFAELVRTGVLVSANGSPCRSQLLEGEDVGGDGFGISALFTCDPAMRDLEVTFPLLDRLPNGHEHFIRLEVDGRTVEKTLSGPERTATLTVRATPPESSVGRMKRVVGIVLDAVELGVGHILRGWDHLLFLAALLLGSRGLRSVVIPITAFTIAHSITLALATLGVYAPSPRWVEPVIAASIAYVSFENMVRAAPSHRWLVTFLFGLIHGFGFAGALQELALPRDRLVPTLLGFNVGVELGQIAVVALALPLLGRLRRQTAFEAHWQRWVSAAMGLAGAAVCIIRIARPG